MCYQQPDQQTLRRALLNRRQIGELAGGPDWRAQLESSVA
jgi:hypothetical protein